MSIDPAVLAKVSGLRAHLGERLRGQDHVLDRAAAVFMRGELGLARADRPRGAFLAVGPTGTGKTELVLLAARYLFGETSVRRFDLSEYQRDDAVERMLGGHASYSGALGRAERVEGRRIWLFDELEKAHPKVFDLFLQILDPGVITLSTGEAVSFAGDYIAFTSNIGAVEAERMARSSFGSIEHATLRRLSQALRPEFMARVPEKFVFARLEPAVLRAIAEAHAVNESTRLKNAGFDVQITRSALDFMLRESHGSRSGARYVRQLVERGIQDAVGRSLCGSGLGNGRLVCESGVLRLDPATSPECSIE
jgi:ATP-dependent Clp protease ATP-binding subunit ClpA